MLNCSPMQPGLVVQHPDFVRMLNCSPMRPGCYIFRDKEGQPIYVGKSKALRKRLKQHFSQGVGRKNRKHSRMVTETASIEFITTESETDALILEYLLIREYLPRCNSQYIRKQVFQYIIIDTALDYPAIYISDAPPEGTAKDFICFYSQGGALSALELLNGVWQTPLCGKPSFARASKQCTYYHIERCCAPCAAKITAEDYGKKIAEIIACFSGDCGAVLQRLKELMLRHSAELDFERAARVKTQLDGIAALGMMSKRLETALELKQVCLFISAYNEPAYSLYFIRYGQVTAKERFEKRYGLCDSLLESFAKRVSSPPDKLDTSKFPPAQALLHIAADKLFTPIPPDADKQQIIKILRRGHRAYIREGNQG